jgi:hypothetical protein
MSFFSKAVVTYCVTTKIVRFFYHELVTYDQNAIHVSVYVTLAFFYFYTQPNRTILFQKYFLLGILSFNFKKTLQSSLYSLLFI